MEIVLGLPEKLPGTLAVAFSISALPCVNRFGQIGNSGHTILTVKAHSYEFKSCGIDTILTMAAGPGKDELVMAMAMAGHMVQYGEASVQYGR